MSDLNTTISANFDSTPRDQKNNGMNQYNRLFSGSQEGGIYTYAIIQGIPVLADPALSPEAIRKFAMEIIQTWTWEGRTLDKIELICDKSWVHACTYAKQTI